ncbi:MAG: hypothetical protein OFPII_00120 [Osedax symbiont Rs1]|nr:MAG: hypothetical protein OFPII_00120 [Osedax symbiont Rs1]
MPAVQIGNEQVYINLHFKNNQVLKFINFISLIMLLYCSPNDSDPFSR